MMYIYIYICQFYARAGRSRITVLDKTVSGRPSVERFNGKFFISAMELTYFIMLQVLAACNSSSISMLDFSSTISAWRL